MENIHRTNYGEIIRKLRTENSMTQTELGKLVSLGKTAISNYETGYIIPSLTVLENISKVFNLTLSQFISYDVTKVNPVTKYQQSETDVIIPYINVRNVKSNVLEAQHYQDAAVVFPEFMADDKQGYICIKMNDDAMSGDGISKNDYLIVKKESLAKPGQIVLVLNKENDTYIIRRYVREGHIASLIPSSDSGNYPVLRIDERDSEFAVAGYVERVISKIDY